MKRREAINILGTTAGGLFIAQFIPGCKSPSGPSDPGKSYDTVEFMYQRVGNIVHPTWQDPTMFMLEYSQIGGRNIYVKQTGPDQWEGESLLDYNMNSQNPYHIWIDDGKVNEWAEDIYARIKGQQNWIKLTLIRPNGTGGEYAVFCINKNGIYFP